MTVLRSLGPPIAVLAVINFVSSVGIAVMLPLLPLYGLSLQASPVELGLLTSAFAVTNAAAALGSGLFLDRFGSRGFIRAGTALYAAANALIATATSATVLIAYRALAGLGAGANITASRLYVSQVADPARLAFTQGILSAAASAGSVAGPAIGGFLALSDLRSPFLLVAITSSIAFVATLALPNPRARATGPRATGTPAVTSAMNRSVVALFLAQLLLLGGYGAFITTYGAAATQLLGWSNLEVALVFTFFAAGDIALGPFVAHLADRVGRRVVASASLVLIGLWTVAFLIGPPPSVLYGVSIVSGAALTGFNASWFALLTEASPEARRGRVFGTVTALSNGGVVAGALISSLVWQSIGLRWGMAVATASVTLAVFALRLLRPAPAPRRMSQAA